MKVIPTFVIATGAVLFVSMVAPARAKGATIIKKSEYTESQVKADCAGFGTFSPSGPTNSGAYGCLYNSGTGSVACGGKGEYADTCTITFRPPRRLPTQAEMQAAEPPVNKNTK